MSGNMAVYDLCVVGAGMFGSAAARHASQTPDTTVCLIGPSEPETRSSTSDRDIFGAYYDEGRMSRCLAADPVWAVLAQKSIARYRELEKQSGVPFYQEVGVLVMGSDEYDITKDHKDVAKEQGVDMEILDHQQLLGRFPYLNVPEQDYGLFEAKQAGYINPRKLVKAQIKCAAQNGCEIIDDIVRQGERVVHPGSNSYMMKVTTERGTVVYCQKVLLATSAYTSFRNVLPAGIIADIQMKPLSMSFLEVNKETAVSLRKMPCVLYEGGASPNWMLPSTHRCGQYNSFYMLPPIQYPNGRYYIKLGLQDSVQGMLHTSADVRKWYNQGDVVVQEAVANLTKSLFQGVQFLSWKGDSCVMTTTPTSRPYIDTIHAQLGVVIGGNGYAAKSSDEIGRIAAAMMLNGWSSELPRDIFKFQNRAPTFLSRM